MEGSGTGGTCFAPSSPDDFINIETTIGAGESDGLWFMFGVFAAESLVLAEAGQQVGARQVAASVSPEQVAFFVCTCDYTLIGEELFGASAYVSREPVQVATLAAQDRFKLLMCGGIVFGVVCATIKALHPDLSIVMPQELLLAGWEVFTR